MGTLGINGGAIGKQQANQRLAIAQRRSHHERRPAAAVGRVRVEARLCVCVQQFDDPALVRRHRPVQRQPFVRVQLLGQFWVVEEELFYPCVYRTSVA